MIIGLSGAHRSGKTTLAREFARRNERFTFVETSVSAMMLSRGFDPLLDYPIEKRLEIQNIILGELDELYSRHSMDAVFDRTPLDAAGYMLADVQRQNLVAELNEPVLAYVNRCFEVTNRRFSMVLFVPSVIEPVIEPGKAPATKGYIEHISMLIQGLAMDQRLKTPRFKVSRNHTSIEHRVLGLEAAQKSVITGWLDRVSEVASSGYSYAVH